MNRKNCKNKNITNITYNIDYDKLAQAIVKAKSIEAEQEKVKEEKLILENKKSKKYKLNFKEGIKFLCFPKKYKQNDLKGVKSLMKTAMSFMFLLIEWFLYLNFGGFVYIIIKELINNNFNVIAPWIMFAVVSLLFARIFRIVKIEIEDLEDINILTNLFGSFLTFISVVIAMVMLFLSVNGNFGGVL